MAGLDALQSVQFVTVQGKRLAVMDTDDWEALIEWLEGVEDTQAVRAALTELAEAGGDRTKADWHKWDDVEGQLE